MKDECQKIVIGMTEVKRENMLHFLAKQNNEWKTDHFGRSTWTERMSVMTNLTSVSNRSWLSKTMSRRLAVLESQQELKVGKCIKLFKIVSSKLSSPHGLFLFSTRQLTKLMNWNNKLWGVFNFDLMRETSFLISK